MKSRIPHPGQLSLFPVDGKHCRGCKLIRDRAVFARDRGRGDGLQPLCKPCHATAMAASNRRHGDKRRAYNRAYSKVYYAAHREEMRAAYRQYAAKHRLQINARQRAWTRRHPEQARAISRAYRLTHPETAIRWRAAHPHATTRWAQAHREQARWHYRIGRQRRRARLRRTIGSHTAQEVQALYEAQAGLCAYCGVSIPPYHIDHETPLMRGGSNSIENISLTCPPCNQRKHTRTASEFLSFLAKLAAETA
jgi:5-methylcytosine-specific restriction endonuclease McrA